MQTENDGRTWAAAWLVVPIGLVLLAASFPDPARVPAEEDKTKEARSSSYDQIAPVLLGQETFPERDGQGQGRQARGHGPPEASCWKTRTTSTPQPDPKVKMTRGKPIQVGPARGCRRG